MEFWDKKTPQEELENIHALVLTGMETNNTELVEGGRYVFIYLNNKYSILYIVTFTSDLYTIQ